MRSLAVAALVLLLAVAGCSHTADAGAPPPIVVVIFDELPVHSLMRPGARLDARRYPNFARLAADATWYRNTTSVEQDTPYAVPAILDGRVPRKERLPVAADHARNIFSMLAGRYQLHVREDATRMCAPVLCRASRALTVPGAVAANRRMPRESKQHRFVRLHHNLAHGRPQRFRRFVAGIEGGRRPRLHLIHILLPHVPFQYLGSGREYRRTPREALPGIDGRPGYDVPFLVRQAYQRHLLQLAATDRLLGLLLDRLQRVGIYDRAVIAVVADHGVSFRVGHDRRLLRRANVPDIAPVPFFVKGPGQHEGRVDDKPLRTIDVLPTIAELAGLRIPWPVDGRSALAPTVDAQRHRRMISKKFEHTLLVDRPSFEPGKRALLARKQRLFGAGLMRFGPRPELLGRRVSPAASDVRVRAAPAGGLVPAHVAGTIPGGPLGGGRTVAVAVDGRVAATGRTFTLAGARAEQLSALVPEHFLRSGAHRMGIRVAAGGALRPVRACLAIAGCG